MVGVGLGVRPVPGSLRPPAASHGLVAELAAAKPEVLLLKNDARERPFQGWLEAEDRLVYQDAHHRLLAHHSVAKTAGY